MKIDRATTNKQCNIKIPKKLSKTHLLNMVFLIQSASLIKGVHGGVFQPETL